MTAHLEAAGLKPQQRFTFWGRNRCYNGGQQHLFEARYDEAPLQMEFETRRLDADEVRRMLYRNVYGRDVCVWCGKTIERGAKK